MTMMGQNRSSPIGKARGCVLYAMALIFCLELLGLAAAAGDMTSTKTLEENPEADYSKRGWKTDLPMWGKRAWSNLHSGWGKRDLMASEEDSNYAVPLYEKRAWQRLQGGWGKRFIPSEEDIMIRQLAAALEENEPENDLGYYPEREIDAHEMDKRNWNKFTDGWGKRSEKWEKFKGSWGKREPAWNNLKGLWGKRSVSE
ncbi:hypothetical protein GWI33_019061 [Rhynchophorus ferrugineus]|uniref:Uncharacterized protein n=1 Tax=Rhynchophorus ferrugineus TaxID=354439 RepID=A0A834I647_RHYFE|nr:hypothetical protein GWI33_019061 [Rhynchophorus ferrugineus]